jgi:hypothetical protein
MPLIFLTTLDITKSSIYITSKTTAPRPVRAEKEAIKTNRSSMFKKKNK